MQLLPVETVDGGLVVDPDIVGRAMMEGEARADRMVRSCAAGDACVGTGSSNARAHSIGVTDAADPSRVNRADGASRRASADAAESALTQVVPGADATDMRRGTEPAEMRAAAETATARFR